MRKSKRILIVDDEPQIQRFLKLGLTAAGYDILLAGDGAEALRQSAAMVPDLVILDLGLPDMDGKDVLARLRQWSSVPVIVLSARDDSLTGPSRQPTGRRRLATDFGQVNVPWPVAQDVVPDPHQHAPAIGVGRLEQECHLGRLRTTGRSGSNPGHRAKR